MKSSLQHIQINVSNKNVSFPFYKDMLTLLGYTVFMEGDWGVGMRCGATGLTVWVAEVEEKYKSHKYHRKAVGLNHLAFAVGSKEDVDKFNSEFLGSRGVKPLYNSPKAFPEYTDKYYAVFFEDPDRIKIEVVSL